MSSGDHETTRKRSLSRENIPSRAQAPRSRSKSKRQRSSDDADIDEIGSVFDDYGDDNNNIDETSYSVSNETSSQAIHGIDEKFIQELVEDIYRLHMPKDFFDFWDFCCRTNPMNPRMALSGIGLELVGPFDVLAGDVDCKPSLNNLIHLQNLAMLHWRYYYDVPEFQTCVRVIGSPTHLHFGYFRDDPKQLPVFVGSNEAAIDCKIQDHGGNLFAAIHQLIVNKIHDSYIEDLSPLKELEEVIRLHAGKFKHTLGTSVDTRQHRPAVASLTWHGAGIVIGSSQILNPQDFTLEHKHHITTDGLLHLLNEACNEEDTHEESGRKRKLEAEKQLVALTKEIEKDVAEGIYETTLEFGIDLFCYGNRLLHKQAKAHMVKGYGLLGRDLFAEISNKYLDERIRGDQLSRLPMK